MPYSLKQLKWANATDQPFAEKWNRQYKQSGLEKGGAKSHMREAAKRLKSKYEKKGR